MSRTVRGPTASEVDDACMWFRHDFGLLGPEDRERVRLEAKEWLRAWLKVRDFEIPPSTNGRDPR